MPRPLPYWFTVVNMSHVNKCATFKKGVVPIDNLVACN